MKRVAGRIAVILSGVLLLAGCGGAPGNGSGTSRSGSTTPAALEDTFTVTLPSIDGDPKKVEVIEIPNGRPIYALLVSGFHQNKQLDMFHFYNFAKCLLKRGAYVHYAWWNNLLAPYMEKPLHDIYSVPSTGAIPFANLVNVTTFPPRRQKAIPRDDVQFQADARRLLIEIRRNNPDAHIILVGHSFGGNAVVRLADSLDDPEVMPPDVPVLDVAILAPIDPVGNRTCVRSYPEGHWLQLLPFCQGVGNFTRWRATHQDWLIDPPVRAFGQNIKYLYHRWQEEGTPPFLGFGSAIYLSYIGDPVDSIGSGSTNVQSVVPTSLYSYPSGGNQDGHGEIVGFRGVDLNPFGGGFIESYPLGLKARGNWPYREAPLDITPEPDIPVWYIPPYPGWPDINRTADRVDLMKAWESNSSYLDNTGYSPEHPEYCMVSGDLCEILRTAVNAAPVADAGPDQTVECSGSDGTPVTLDGSGSSDPNDDLLSYTWTGPFGIKMGKTVTVELPLGMHTITLTVEDGRGKSDTDTVDVAVIDSAPPSLSVSLSQDVLWPPNHQLESIAASIQVVDICDESPSVMLRRIVSSESDNGLGDGDTAGDIQGAAFGTDDREFSLRAERAGNGPGRVYTITYGAADASGNVAEDATAKVTVPHDRSNVSR